MRVLPACVCTTFMPAAHGGQESALICLEVALKMVVSHLWVLATKSISLAKAASALNPGPTLHLGVYIFKHK